MFENQYRSYVLQNEFMQKLASAGTDLTNYFGVFHPSQTNYVAALAGELCSVADDNAPMAGLPQQTLVDLLEEGGCSWKAYMEGLPLDPWKSEWSQPSYDPDVAPVAESPEAPDLARYFRKHNAFASFQRIQASKERWANIVDDDVFWADVAAGVLPDFGWFTPDIWNDGHYLTNTHIDTNPRVQLIPQISTWLEHVFFGSIEANKRQGAQRRCGFGLDVDLLLTDPQTAWEQSSIPPGTAILVTFDEADFDASDYDTTYDGPNQVYSVLLGPGIAPGSIDPNSYNHYSMIRTVCRNFGLNDLGKNDVAANPFRSLWNEHFCWSPALDTGATTAAGMAATRTSDGFQLFTATAKGEVHVSSAQESRQPSGWSTPAPFGLRATGALAAASLEGETHVVAVNDGALAWVRQGEDGTWSAVRSLGDGSASVALCSFHDDADAHDKLMLCWQGNAGAVSYRVFANDVWGEVGDTGVYTSGPIAVEQFGASLYLVGRDRRGHGMRMTSYNVAPFNSFDVTDFKGEPSPDNATTLHRWSPFDVSVGAFSQKFSALQNNYQVGGDLTMVAAPGALLLAHRGRFEDTPHAFTESFGLTGVLTAASADGNLYGTLAQAGWSQEQKLSQVELDVDSLLCSTKDADSVHLFWQAKDTGHILHTAGGFRSDEVTAPATG